MARIARPRRQHRVAVLVVVVDARGARVTAGDLSSHPWERVGRNRRIRPSVLGAATDELQAAPARNSLDSPLLALLRVGFSLKRFSGAGEAEGLCVGLQRPDNECDVIVEVLGEGFRTLSDLFAVDGGGETRLLQLLFH